MIEHVPYESGLRVLRECHRVLKLGGVLRIATPDLDFVRPLTDLAPYDENVAAYIKASNTKWDTHLGREAAANPVFVINRMMRKSGHTFLYDQATLFVFRADGAYTSLAGTGPPRHGRLPHAPGRRPLRPAARPTGKKGWPG